MKMKITRYVHSCLLIETDERVGIIDPGNFSWQSGLFDVSSLSRLDDIVITHEHADHMHLPFVEALVAKFPEVNIVTTESAKQQLVERGIKQVQANTSPVVELFSASHESIQPLAPTTPENVGVHYLDRLSHPGDSHSFNETKEILAMPTTAPWGNMVKAIELGLKLKPKFIIPIHDWHWRDDAIAGIYERISGVFSENGIEFITPKDGQGFEI